MKRSIHVKREEKKESEEEKRRLWQKKDWKAEKSTVSNREKMGDRSLDVAHLAIEEEEE